MMLPSGQQIRYVRFRYIHIWASEQELKAKSTDPAILEKIIQAILKSYPKAEFETHRDINGQFHAFRMRVPETETDQEGEKSASQRNIYLGLAWWMFRILCDRGWEPMETSPHTYKLKYQQVINPEEM
jgi:hypothetical protein